MTELLEKAELKKLSMNNTKEKSYEKQVQVSGFITLKVVIFN